MSIGTFHQCRHILNIHEDLWCYLHRKANALYYERWCENIISSLFNKWRKLFYCYVPSQTMNKSMVVNFMHRMLIDCRNIK